MRTLTLLLLLLAGNLHAQTYTVIHVIGKIYDTGSGSYLASGSKLNENAQLKFESPDARAAALSSTRGRFVIQKEAGQSSTNNLVYALSSVLAPARGKMSTRAGGINNPMDFAKKFGEGPVAIVGSRYTVAVSDTAYPTGETQFFYASYQYNNETINKKLNVEEGSLIFDVGNFYAVDDSPIDPNLTSEATLYYYDSNKEESVALTPLEFVVITTKDLSSMAGSLGDMELEEKISSLQEIIVSLYGNCDHEQIRKAVANLN